MAHESIAGGVHKAWTRAFDDHCEALQVFVRTSRAWAAPPLTDESVRSGKSPGTPPAAR